MGPWTSVHCLSRTRFGMMPGDTVRLSVYAKYDQPTKTKESITGMAGVIASTISQGADADAVMRVSRDLSKVFAAGEAGVLAKDNNVPKAYLNYIFFDKEMKSKATNFKQVTEAAHGSFEELDMEFIAEEEGYLMAYTSNQTNENLNVFMDQMSLTHTTGPIVRVDDYYPFGLTFKSSELDGRLTNKFLYNGKEREELTGLDDFGFRQYNPSIGRWHTVDKMADVYFASSPYAYALNTPVNAIDPDGNLVIFINGYTQNKEEQGTKQYWRRPENMFAPPPHNRWAFDIEVSNQLRDHNRHYVHGGNYITPEARYTAGFAKGYEEAAMIINKIIDQYGNVTETIKIIAHSMGSVYGKAYVAGLLKYIEEKELGGKVFITLIADFDPFQAAHELCTSFPNIFNQQFWHKGKFFKIADQVQQGVDDENENKNKSEHSIYSFFDNIQDLQEGTYKWNETRQEWVCTTCQD